MSAPKPNQGGPAFPVPYSAWGEARPGMSLRAWLAGQALVGATVNPSAINPSASDDRIAQACVRLADAVLAELQKGGPQ